MDKKLLLGQELINLLNQSSSQIDDIVSRHPVPSIKTKDDGSPVTLLDLELSSFVEKILQAHSPEVTFYSEENFSKLDFPLLALDPLDGTREYINGNDEWALSVGIFQNKNFEGEGWIYNPKTKELFTQGKDPGFREKTIFSGEVSHSEWESGLFKTKNQTKFQLKPVGSIAYKLGRLSKGNCDFVVSLRPKNIWDIAGGTNLIQQSGMHFYSQGKKVKEVKELYLPPLIWCREEISAELLKIYS